MRIIPRYLICLFTFSVSYHLCAQETCQLTGRLANFAPYSFKNPNGTWDGIDYQIAKTLSSEIGCSMKIIEAPFGRSFKLLETGQIDFMMQLAKTKERQKYLFFIGPLYIEEMRIATRNDTSLRINSLKDIENIKGKIAIQRGAFISKQFEHELNTNKKFRQNIMVLTTAHGLIEMLVTDRVTGLVIEDKSLRNSINSNPKFKEITIQPIKLNQEPLFVGFSKKRTPTGAHKKLESAYLKLVSNGQIEKIISQYLDSKD